MLETDGVLCVKSAATTENSASRKSGAEAPLRPLKAAAVVCRRRQHQYTNASCEAAKGRVPHLVEKGRQEKGPARKKKQDGEIPALPAYCLSVADGSLPLGRRNEPPWCRRSANAKRANDRLRGGTAKRMIYVKRCIITSSWPDAQLARAASSWSRNESASIKGAMVE